MAKELAEGILALDFPEPDVVRADELNAKANGGTLTEEEQVELEAYVSIADMLAYWQSKARQVLRQAQKNLTAHYAAKRMSIGGGQSRF